MKLVLYLNCIYLWRYMHIHLFMHVGWLILWNSQVLSLNTSNNTQFYFVWVSFLLFIISSLVVLISSLLKTAMEILFRQMETWFHFLDSFQLHFYNFLFFSELRLHFHFVNIAQRNSYASNFMHYFIIVKYLQISFLFI